MTRTPIVAVLLFLAPLGCAVSHGASDGATVGDGGGMDAAAVDASTVDGAPSDRRTTPYDTGAPLPDGPLPDGTDCSQVDGFRRCGPGCPYLCPGSPPVRCSNYLPLCLPRGTAPCDFGLGESVPENYCSNGGPCLLSGASPDNGACVSLDLCLTNAANAGLPPFHCVWPDMTPVTRAPPAAPCPAPADPQDPFCGGSCGASCSDLPVCVGVSDHRAFGLCRMWGPCWQAMGGELAADMDRCSQHFGTPCACMIPEPQPSGAPFPRGEIVLASSCLAYHAIYPSGVECRDANWNVLH